MPADVPDVASWNPYAGNSVANMKAGITALIDAGADVIGMQEMSEDKSWLAVRDWLQGQGWFVVGKNNAIPIYVRPTYEVTDWASTTYNDDKPTVEDGAGGTRAPVKSIMRVTVRHREHGTVSHHFNLHIIATIEKGGKVGATPKRLAFAQGHIDLLLKLARPYLATGEPVTVTADWNVSSSTDAGAWLRKQMEAAGFRSAQHQLGPFNTHGVREIDDVYFAHCAATKFRLLAEFGSDHCPIEVDLGPIAAPGDSPTEENDGMAKSQNGWTAASTTAGIPGGTKRITPVGAPGTQFTVRAGDVATVFQYLVDQFQARVEDIDLYTKGSGDDWGFASRPIRGSATGLSNHASGTAVDINATRHPLGVGGSMGFTEAQRDEIRQILRELRGAVRWGGDYSGRKDGMHFEINASRAKLKQVADDIRSGNIRPAGTTTAVKPKPGDPAPPKPAAHKPLISRTAVVAGLKAGSSVLAGHDGEQYKIMLNRKMKTKLSEDALLTANTRQVTAWAQLEVAKANGNTTLTRADCWPNKGHDPDLDGLPGEETFKFLGIDNSDDNA